MTQENGVSASQTGLSPTVEPVPVSPLRASIPNATYLPVWCEHCKATKSGYPAGLCEICGRFGNALDLTPNPLVVLIAAERMKPEQSAWLKNIRGFPELPPPAFELAEKGYLVANAAPAGWSAVVTAFGAAVASAIEARSDATGTGAAEGESAAPAGGDAQ